MTLRIVMMATASLLLGVTAAAEPSAPPAVTKAPSPAVEVTPPRLLTDVDVAYPKGAVGESTVVLVLTVNADGTVRSARAVEGDEPFASAAVAGAAAWKFSPAMRGEQPVAAVIRFEITFHAPVELPAPTKTAAPSDTAVPTKTQPSPATTAVASAAIEVQARGVRAAPMVSSFSRAEVRQLPGAFGDPFRAIEAMPGVTPVVSGLPFFYVRGAPPGNVGYFVDGVRVPYLYHVGLGPSVVNPAMIDRVDLYPGGYPARFGRFAGGIVSGETTAPREDLHGEGNIRIFDVGALAETGFAGGRGTVLLGGRYSYTAAILSLISKGTALDYRDYQARVTYDLTRRDTVSLLSFGSYDLLGQDKLGTLDVLFGSEFYRLDLRYDHAFDNGAKLRIATTLGYDQTRIADQQNATDRMAGMRVEFDDPLSKAVTFRAGADGTLDGFRAAKQAYEDPDNPNTQRFDALFPPRSDLGTGVWAEVNVRPIPQIELTPGLRMDLFGSGDATAYGVDPRISARTAITRKVRFIQAYGLAHQAPSFVVPIPGLTPGTLKDGLQKAFQTSAGVEAQLPDDTTVTATLFHNAFYDMTDTLGTATVLSGGFARNLSQRSNGQGIGFELFVHRKLTKKLGGFASYTLSRSTRTIGNESFPSAFDRTHVANAAIAYDLGKNWRAGTRLVFYTGVPETPRLRGLIAPPPETHPPRDPPFFRVDLRLEKRWTIGRRGWLSFVLEMLNATLSKETIDSQTIGPVTIPSIGLEGGF